MMADGRQRITILTVLAREINAKQFCIWRINRQNRLGFIQMFKARQCLCCGTFSDCICRIQVSVNIVSQTRRMLFMLGNEDLALVIIPLVLLLIRTDVRNVCK